MRQIVTFTLALVVLTTMAVRPIAAQESAAVKTIAGILMTINHFPSDTDKKTLTTLAGQSSTTDQEKVLITAILGMMHSIAAADKPKVEAVMKDAKASAGVKQIATILSTFLHTASDADKAALKKLAT
jgi:hypothetical protein